MNNVDVDCVELLIKEEASTTNFRYILVYGVLEQIYILFFALVIRFFCDFSKKPILDFPPFPHKKIIVS